MSALTMMTIQKALPEAIPLAIASLYLALVSTLITVILHSFYRRLQTHTRYTSWAILSLFSLLCGISLAIPSYHRYSHFHTLYKSWHLATYVSASLHHLHSRVLDATYYPSALRPQFTEWLRTTTPWVSIPTAASISPERVWWAQQRAFAGLSWALFVTIQGYLRGVPYLWAYMLLSQLTGSISFAANMFFLAILLHPLPPRTPSPTPPKRRTLMPMWLPQTYTTLFAFASLAIYARQSLVTNQTAFLVTWILPNILIYIPLYVFPDNEDEARCRETVEYWKRLYSFILLSGTVAHIVAWKEVFALVNGDGSARDLVKLLAEVLGETLWPPGRNGIVAAVGWDVVLLGLSVSLWMGMRGRRWIMPVVKGITGPFGGGWGQMVTGWVLMAFGSVAVVAGGFAGELDFR
ncbi:hypothetical protein EDC01DRAFT_726583 [Geopyxis carbonaria]|nr:hypothetical protein EDC01DRAFT_726583 [Geopyxis carbonaria]